MKEKSPKVEMPLELAQNLCLRRQDWSKNGRRSLDTFIEQERELQLTFDFGLGKPIVASFDGGKVSSDAGLVLVRSADNSLRLSEQIAFCVRESRQLGKEYGVPPYSLPVPSGSWNMSLIANP